MTEMKENSEVPPIHWIGFFTALLAAPIVVGGGVLAPLYLLEIIYKDSDVSTITGVMNVLTLIGSALYFLIGTPVLIAHLRQHAPRMAAIVSLSLISLVWILGLGALFSLGNFNPAPLLFALISMAFGVVGAPPLAAVFTLIYRRFVIC